jgi:hypothetical protein
MKAGDKVVCVDDRDREWSSLLVRPNGKPTQGLVYCVSDFFPSGSRLHGHPITQDCLRIAGHPTIIRSNGLEWVYMASCFRPVSEVGHPPVSIGVANLLTLTP